MPDHQEPANSGFVAKTMRRWFMRASVVVAIEQLSPRFQLFTLGGDALRKANWSAGQKVQIAIGEGLTKRTYTPFNWNADDGTVRLLAYIHGSGPGSRWAEELRQGGQVEFLGPRPSIDLEALSGRVVLFGDETAFALAAALQGLPQPRDVVLVLEADDAKEAQRILAVVGIEDARVVQRTADNAHLSTAAAELVHHAADGSNFVLAGKAQSIQHVSRALKSHGVSSARINAKAYWAPGKTGLD